ncbi:hypothetical protein F4777DRAFT_566846 [Nemania sp. FL0916]|nr:hypothetical protein F4777DRAFT_566846 [Nemania sp. FL0916]
MMSFADQSLAVLLVATRGWQCSFASTMSLHTERLGENHLRRLLIGSSMSRTRVCRMTGSSVPYARMTAREA